MKIAIGMPTNRLIKSKTAQSVMRLVANTKVDYDYLFFIDDDQVFPPDTLDELLLCDKDIVGCVYKTKYETQADVCEYFDDERPQGLFKVKAIGTGCLLIKCDVFRRIPQSYPEEYDETSCGWFNYIWNDNGSVAMSHDWLFCKHARECGYDIWALNTLEIGHIGQFCY